MISVLDLGLKSMMEMGDGVRARGPGGGLSSIGVSGTSWGRALARAVRPVFVSWELSLLGAVMGVGGEAFGEGGGEVCSLQ